MKDTLEPYTPGLDLYRHWANNKLSRIFPAFDSKRSPDFASARKELNEKIDEFIECIRENKYETNNIFNIPILQRLKEMNCKILKKGADEEEIRALLDVYGGLSDIYVIETGIGKLRKRSKEEVEITTLIKRAADAKWI